MTDIAGIPASTPGTPLWLRCLYAVVVVSAVALATLLLGEIVYSFEEHEDGEHEHGFYGPIFDAAWFVFLPTVLFALIAGLVAVAAGIFRRSADVTRFGVSALAYVAVAVAAVVIVETVA
jgi:uncharacterized membrane protein YhaH (DUF805 family)